MATGTIVPLEKYLTTSYEPKCEYLDGKLVERNVGEVPHADLQGLIYAWFLSHRKAWGVHPLVDVRVRIRERDYRIPDICIVRGGRPAERTLTVPPWIWIEVLSPADQFLPLARRVREILDFGCEWVWAVDADTLESWVYTKHTDYAPPGDVFRIPGTEIAVPLHELENQ